MKLNKLITQIKQIDSQLKKRANLAVNQSLTIRNWFVGCYIVEYEQKGEDRAQYGKKLLSTLSEKINIKGLSETNLKLCRQFYSVYPQIASLISQKNKDVLSLPISQLSTDELQITENEQHIISRSVTDQSANSEMSYLNKLIANCSFTHFVELIKIEDNTKRQFYELLVLKTTASVEELKRQISTLAFERVGLSENTDLAFKQLEQKVSPKISTDIVKSHYLLDFLNINNPRLIEEKEIETAILNNLSEFILELGNGFCFEARQKRLLIGEKYYFVDLVFYHRILRCHVLIELKVGDFEQANAGQLNAYINYYKKNIQQEYDNPPVGILLVTDKNNALVEYATAGMDENLFVSKYLLQLPSKKTLEKFIKDELKDW
jgi:predicted nuclease of restriction endonuclease-like (RecB) superfamily